MLYTKFDTGNDVNPVLDSVFLDVRMQKRGEEGGNLPRIPVTVQGMEMPKRRIVAVQIRDLCLEE